MAIINDLKNGRIFDNLFIRNKQKSLSQTLGATLVLTSNMPNKLILDPGGAARAVTLPAVAAGLWFEITNVADALENLTVSNAGGTVIGALGLGQTGLFFCDGTTWFGANVGEGANHGIVNITASASLTRGAHGGKLITCNAAAGMTLTLPPAIGSGVVFEFFTGTTVTSNNLIIAVIGNDTMKGTLCSTQDAADTLVGWETASDSDTITMNGSTKGGIIGDRITLIDAAADVWSVQGMLQSTGTEATPFSAAVS